MRHFSLSRTFPAALAIAALLTGCSPVAWAPRETPHTSSIDLGEQLTLQLRDGSIISGTYESMQDLTEPEYERYYGAAVRATTGRESLPAIGQTVSYSTSVDESKVWEGRLVGFDESFLLVSAPGTKRIDKVYISSLGSLTGLEGRRIRRLALRELYVNGAIPLLSSIVIRNATDRRQIPLNQIERIGRPLEPNRDSAGYAWLAPHQVSWARH